MIDNERTSEIEISGEKYLLILTTKATREIAKRYGGLKNLGDHLMNTEDTESALSEIIWLITLLANQSVMIENLKSKKNQRELLTEEKVELLTSPFDLAKYKDAILEAMQKGTKRNIESEESEKNVPAP